MYVVRIGPLDLSSPEHGSCRSKTYSTCCSTRQAPPSARNPSDPSAGGCSQGRARTLPRGARNLPSNHPSFYEK